MKTINTRLFVVLCGVLIPLLTANCSDKKATETAGTAETAKTESVIDVAAPPFKKFVVVTTEESALHQRADANSPWITRWIESDCESDYCENIFQWSDQPAKPGFEMSTDILVSTSDIYPLLGEEGDFYKVYTIQRWCDIESAYIAKADVDVIECSPITADQLESEDDIFKCSVVKDGKYKGIVLFDEYNELDGEYLNVGMLIDGVVATPVANNIECYLNIGQKEAFVVNQAEENNTISFNTSLAATPEEGENPQQLDPKKLNAEQIAKIMDLVSKRKSEYVKYTYHFPAQGLLDFYYKP